MIEGNLISYILDILHKEKEALSDYSSEYITALLMNLSLRTSGKNKLEEQIQFGFQVLDELIDSESE